MPGAEPAPKHHVTAPPALAQHRKATPRRALASANGRGAADAPWAACARSLQVPQCPARQPGPAGDGGRLGPKPALPSAPAPGDGRVLVTPEPQSQHP